MGDKINVLVIPSDRYGVGYYRSIWPHTKLQDLYGEEFNVDFEFEPKWRNLAYFTKYNIIHFHKGIYSDEEGFSIALQYFKENNIITIMDIDDYWVLPTYHYSHNTFESNRTRDIILNNIKTVDYVTTTTEIFADKIRKYNKNVFVLPNAIDDEAEQFKPIKNESEKIRFGFVMGSSHIKDMEMLNGISNILKNDGTLGKMQFVLCGFDTRGTALIWDEKQQKYIGERSIRPQETVWYEYEKILTDNYRSISGAYSTFLHMFLNNAQYPNVDNESYRREWTKDINEFGTHYRNVDVLLCPLAENDFNSVKSQLKFIEAGFTNTAVIASNFGPYTLDSINLFDKGGVVNENGNCILIGGNKNSGAWAKAIKRLVNNPGLITLLKENLNKTVIEKYNLKTITEQRAALYKSFF